MSKIVDIYAPGNKLTEKQQAEMHDLTDEQITELAKAYPNQPRGNIYLVYYNTSEKPHEQRYPLGTWANLANLRKLGQKNILAHAFRSTFHAPKRASQTAPVQQRVVDLSIKDVEKAEGLKKAVVVEPVKAKEPEVSKVAPESFELTELEALEAELKELQEAKAHHMTIKAVQNKIDALKGEEQEVTTKVDLSNFL